MEQLELWPIKFAYLNEVIPSGARIIDICYKNGRIGVRYVEG